MQVLKIQALGVIVFLVGSIWLAAAIRRPGHRGAAASMSRVSHALVWLGLVLPGTVGLFHPGLTAYDGLLGMPDLSARSLWIAIGVVLESAGLVLLLSSNRFLITKGGGAAAFLLTERLVTDGWYGRTRNPMSLGFYAACVGAGMIAGSLTVTAAALLIIVPAHIFHLKCFEERELELRYGRSYIAHKRRVPFLLPRFRQGGSNTCI
jgi:protein-S-isoprenylcysteine O-methyltransferase Ste14